MVSARTRLTSDQKDSNIAQNNQIFNLQTHKTEKEYKSTEIKRSTLLHTYYAYQQNPIWLKLQKYRILKHSSRLSPELVFDRLTFASR